MIALNKNYIITSYQGFYEIKPNEGHTALNTFNFVNKIIHTWIIKKFADSRIPRNPRTWSWSGVSRSIDIIHDYDTRLYCIKVIHADEEVPGRTWTVEASVFIKDDKLYIAARTSYTSEDSGRDYRLCNPPKFINVISSKCRLYDAGETLDSLHDINSEEDVENLYLIINDKQRAFPVIVISEDQSQDEVNKYLQSQEEGYHIDGGKLAESLKLIAHVYYLPQEYQAKWIEWMTMKWAAAYGAVRTYNPGFDIDEEETMTGFEHPIALPRNILPMSYINDDGREIWAGHAFRHILTHRIKQDNMYRKYDWEERGVKFYYQVIQEADVEAENDVSKLRSEIQKLKNEIEEKTISNNMHQKHNDELAAELNKRKRENIYNQQRIYELESRLKELKDYVPVEYPKNYRDIPEWVFSQFAGRLELHKKALKCLKDNPVYEDIELLCKSIEFLAKDYYDMKTGRIEKTECDEVRRSLGIENQLTGSEASAGRQKDAYWVDYPGGHRRLDMHIKGGKSMNSSDPRERFRIYYFWDDQDQRIVIGYLPDHLPLSNN